MSKVKRNYPVQGLNCASCVAHVERALSKVAGVSAVNVSLASNSAAVEYDTAVTSPGELRAAVQEAGYDLLTDGSEDDADIEAEQARERSWRQLRADTLLSSVLAAVVMVLGMGHGIHFPGKDILLCALSAPVVFWFGRRFYKSGFGALRHGSANMDTLVALSVSISWFFSAFNLLFPQVWTSRGLEAHLYFESATVIVAFILIGRLLEERAKHSTTAAIRSLMGLQSKDLSVQAGDVVAVKPGSRIAVDGVVLDGGSYVDESMLTGEPVPAVKKPGDRVYAGTLNQSGFLSVRAEKVGQDTLLSGIIRMVRDAQGSKAPVQHLVDRIAAVFVPVIIGLSLLSLLAWCLWGGQNGVSIGLLCMVSILVIACPCSLGLATPTAIIAGIGNGASHGILIKNAGSLQTARKVDALVLDKTGTLTEGKPSVVESVWDPSAAAALRDVLFSLESRSDHPLAAAVCASLRGCEALEVTAFETLLGKGVRGEIDGKTYFVGNLELLREAAPDSLSAAAPIVADSASEWMLAGHTLSFLFDTEKVHAVLALSDELRDSALQAVRSLQAMGKEVHLLTGDNEAAARRVAAETGITRVRANVLPQDKAQYVQQLQAQGLKVAMVGDGINDSAALARADLGIAMGGGADIAIDAAQVTIVSGDLSKVPELIRLSRRSVRIIRENLFWAFFYNLLAVPVAAGIFYPFLVSPMLAAACMALSSICVVCNSLRLRR